MYVCITEDEVCYWDENENKVSSHIHRFVEIKKPV